MKYLSTIIFIFSLYFLSSCKNDYFEGENMTLLNYNVTAKFTNGKPASPVYIELKNLSTGNKTKQETDDNGRALFQNLLPGDYELNAVCKLNKDEYYKVFGVVSTEEEVTFNGILQSVNINSQHISDDVELVAGKISPIIIKQIYYAASDIVDGASIRDQFIEIYNNSGEIQYADNLCFAQIEGKRNPTITPFTLTNGQYNWALGEGQETNIGNTANTDYVYAITIFRINGSGKEHPIMPGKSVLIASTALNHKAPFTNNDGEQEYVNNPDLTVDLSNADYEAYLGDWWIALGWEPYFLDIQNPFIPDLGIDYFEYGRDMLFDPYGRDAFVLFRATKDEVSGWRKVHTPGNPDDGKFVRIPKTHILDGVDLTMEAGYSKIPKKLPVDIDGGQTFTSLGAYQSQSVIRKTEKIVNGRIILQDTNNSLYDFISQKANPRGFQE